MNNEQYHTTTGSKSLPSKVVEGTRKYGILILALLMVGLIFPSPASARWDMEIRSDLYLRPEPNNSISFGGTETTFMIQEVLGKIEDYPGQLTSLLYWPYTKLADTGFAGKATLTLPYEEISVPGPGAQQLELLGDIYFAEEYGADYPIGTWGGSSQIKFEGDTTQALDYWINNLIVNYGGFSYKAVSLLQKNMITGDYGSGVELSISGTKFSGVAITIENWFGLQENPLELAGFQVESTYGSGYILSPGYNYQGTKVIFKNLSVGPVKFDTETKMKGDGGFDYTRVTTELESENAPLSMEATLLVQTGSKTLQLAPNLDMEWGCIEVETDFDVFRGGNGEESSILTVQGLRLTEVNLGQVTAYWTTSFAGNLYKRADKSNLELHARDYLLDVPEEFTDVTESKVEKTFVLTGKPFEETDYDHVFSLEGGTTDSSFNVDIYLGGKDPASLFELGLITGNYEQNFADNFALSGGVGIDPQKGLDVLKLSATAGF